MMIFDWLTYADLHFKSASSFQMESPTWSRRSITLEISHLNFLVNQAMKWTHATISGFIWWEFAKQKKIHYYEVKSSNKDGFHEIEDFIFTTGFFQLVIQQYLTEVILQKTIQQSMKNQFLLLYILVKYCKSLSQIGSLTAATAFRDSVSNTNEELFFELTTLLRHLKILEQIS